MPLTDLPSACGTPLQTLSRCRFRENTLVVCSTQMEEARIYSMEGKLLLKERGNYVEFELEPGTYRLFAKVGDSTERRRIELR